MTYQQALEKIHSLDAFGSRPGLDRIKKLLNILGNPQDKLKFVHVAGTNGKGSTCALISSVLTNAGYKTGLFISPYITDFCERIQINGKPVDGQIFAGPKVLEHMVDCVLYFEGDPNSSYRLLRAAKNRFGSTNEIGVFEMADSGLIEVPNPSQMLLEGRPEGASGTCVACVMEGTRPILAEVQALVSKTSFNVPRRTADGFDFNRSALLLAVAEKRAGMKLSAFDAYINVIGGLRLDEPGADLPVVLAVASSYRDSVIPDDLVAIGEVGLTGEIRSVSNMNQRLAEVARLGFKKCIIPKNGSEKLEIPTGLTVYRVRNLREAIEVAM